MKSIIIVKPLTCALNPALNCVKPLAVSRFAIKALRVYTVCESLVNGIFTHVTDRKSNAGHSYVLGWASSPELAELSPFKPKLSWALTRACNRLGPGFRFQKPKPRAQAQALIPQVTWGADSQLER